MKIRLAGWVLAAVACASIANASTITLGSFNFNSDQFGNTLLESDGGAYRMSNWLNIVNMDPGNPGALTGPNFNTGIANIGLLSTKAIDYTIGYNTPIVNGPGNDMGLVTGFSYRTDTYHVAVSTDGVNFTPFVDFKGSSGTDTMVTMSYFYSTNGVFSTNLIVVPIDLTAFGIAPGGSVVAARLQGRPGEEPDLFRIAGFESNTTMPEPGSLILMGSGLLGLVGVLRRKLAS